MELFKHFQYLQQRGILSRIDVEFCRFLRKEDYSVSDEVLLAGAITSNYYSRGNVCVALRDIAASSLFEGEGGEREPIQAPALQHWLKELKKSSLVGISGDYKPLILDSSHRLYLHKSWQYEHILAHDLQVKSNLTQQSIDRETFVDGLDRLFGRSTGKNPDWQKIAAVSAVLHPLTIISGGPGTGKTSTVIRILALFLEQGKLKGRMPSVVLAAPTGKAATRLKESIRSSRQTLNIDEDIRSAIPEQAVTLHQLLGARRHTSRVIFNKKNPLPYDMVIVDEASMIDQALMNKLLEALLGNAHLILLGDKDQLASVEAGAIIGDLCTLEQNRLSESFINTLDTLSIEVSRHFQASEVYPLTDNIFLFTQNYRFDHESGIARLAEAVNAGDGEHAYRVLSNGSAEDVHLITVSGLEDIYERLERLFTRLFTKINKLSSVDEIFNSFNEFRILTAHREGPWGVETLNMMVERILHRHGFIPKHKKWYLGKPVIIHQNNYALNLFNGDIGICFPDEKGELNVFFHQDGAIRSVSPLRLPEHSLAYSLTVHKSQGSEFERVLLILPQSPSRIITRELIYTAITRAVSGVEIMGTWPVLYHGIKTPTLRTSGLQDLLWEKA